MSGSGRAEAKAGSIDVYITQGVAIRVKAKPSAARTELKYIKN